MPATCPTCQLFGSGFGQSASTRNCGAAAFEARYGTGLPVTGEYSGQFSNGGEEITLVADLGGTLLDFDYDDEDDWPSRADGLGASLEVISTAFDYDDAESWRSSSEYHGSPAVAGTGPIDSIVINEVLTLTEAPRSEAVELVNVSADAVDLSGWYLSDISNDYRKFRFPAGTILAAGEYRVFDEEDFNSSGTSADFAFAGDGGLKIASGILGRNQTADGHRLSRDVGLDRKTCQV